MGEKLSNANYVVHRFLLVLIVLCTCEFTPERDHISVIYTINYSAITVDFMDTEREYTVNICNCTFQVQSQLAIKTKIIGQRP